jgi:hypothetical protein
MAGIEAPEYQVNVSQENLINKFAVQGEENSRVLTLHLVETVQTVTALEETVIRQKPLDLTGCTTRLYTKKPDGNATFIDGEITAYGADGTENTVLFTLTQQTLAAAGNAHCTVAIFGQNGTELKATGITLDIAADDMEQTIVSTSEFVSLAKALGSVQESEQKADKAVSDSQAAVTKATTAIVDITQKQTDMDTAESKRVTAESRRAVAESSRDVAEQNRELASQTAVGNADAATTRTDAAADKANHVPQRDASGVWKDWDAESKAYKNSTDKWKGEKGDAGANFAYGESYATLEALQAAYPTGDSKGHLVGGTACIWDGTAWVARSVDLSEYYKKKESDAKYAGINHTHTAAQVGAAPDTHVDVIVSSETGVHGLRYYSDKLQAKDSNNNWQDIATGGSTGLAPADVSELAATSGDKQVTIVWSDPADSVIEGVTVSKWDGSKLVRKEGAYPTDVTDGILLVDNKTRDTYKTTGYIDSNLTNGTTYYYAVFPYSDTGAVNKNEANRVSAVPTTYPLPACTGISASAGNGQITVYWADSIDVEGQVTWAGSKLVRKVGSYPTTVTDGTLVIDNTTRDQYKTAGYVDTGLTNGTTYYYMIFPYSTTGDTTINTANQVSAAPRASVKYGVIWHETLSSPVLERIDDSANFTATATDGSTAGHSDFDNEPIYKDIKICNVVNRQVVAYEGDATFKRDGSNGDVCVEIPKFYYKVSDNGTDRTYEISDAQLDGFLVAPRHAPCTDYPNGLDKIYLGVYEASAGFKSISGVAPLVNLTRAQFRTGFAARGTGYCQADMATQAELYILYKSEMANLNSQSEVGNGNVNTSAAINTGGSDSVTGMTGCADKASQSIAVKYRGMENLWGNVYEWRDGINFNDGLIYVCANPSKYADDTATNYTKLAYSKIQANGLISSLGLDASIPWVQVPTAVDGSDSTYLCDYYYFGSGWRVPFVGGCWGNGSYAGLFYLYSNYASSSFNSYFGSRLLVLPQ